MSVCDRFEDRLPELVAGILPLDEDLELRLHAEACVRCGSLWAAATRDDPPTGPPTGDAMVDEILRRTSGRPCGAAEQLLAESGSRAASTDEALRWHLDRCGPCRAVARVIGLLERELPAMREVQPGPDFLEEVLAQTSSAPGAARSPARLPIGHPLPAIPRLLSAARARAAGAWSRAVHRRRMPLEWAYVGATVVYLLVGTPASPLRDLPPAVLRTFLSGGQTVGHAVQRLDREPGVTEREAPRGSSGLAFSPVPGFPTGMIDDLSGRFQRIRQDLRVGGSLFQDRVSGTWKLLGQVGGDTWRALSSGETGAVWVGWAGFSKALADLWGNRIDSAPNSNGSESVSGSGRDSTPGVGAATPPDGPDSR